MKSPAIERTAGDVVLANGALKVRFVRRDGAWHPDWFTEGGRPMVRFKDHEWLSIGHVTGPMTDLAVEDGRLVFGGMVRYGSTPVEQRVEVGPARDGGTGFTVESALRPSASIELLEALTSFETPYEYDGREDSLVVIGAQAVVHWRDGALVSRPLYEHPAWIYNHPEQARTATQPWSTHLSHRVSALDGSNRRWIRIIGHPAECSFREMFATTTRPITTDGSAPARFGARGARGLRGWKYIPCALNWSSALVKDPNVLVEKGGLLRQAVTIDFAGGLDIELDVWVYEGWERLLAEGFPPDAHVPAGDLVRRLGASWRKASAWSLDVLRTDPIACLGGYLPGTRPKADPRPGLVPAQWLAPAAYHAVTLGDAALRERVAQLLNTAVVGFWRTRAEPFADSGVIQTQLLPSLQAVDLLGGECAALRDELERVLGLFERAEVEVASSNYGTRAVAASAALHAARIYRSDAWRRRFLAWVDSINANARLDRWWWASAQAERDAAGQIRPLGMGYMIEANLRAHRETGEAGYLRWALFYARIVLAVCAIPADAKLSEDLDLRGWMNGSNTGRDQICQIPPWETFSAARAVAAVAGFADVPPGFYDNLWYLQRTGLAAFPAARTLKRIHDARYTDGPRYVPVSEIASERDFYLAFPYMAYENPHDQTLLASYQSEPIWNAMVLGGVIAEAADERILALVPGAALFDRPDAEGVAVRLWNPTSRAITTDVTVAGGTRPAVRDVAVPPRVPVKVRVVTAR